MRFQNGQRIRVLAPDSEYTGCRGTIADDPTTLNDDVVVLGHMVAIDGENGMVRPFLTKDLVALRGASVAARSAAQKSVDSNEDPH